MDKETKIVDFGLQLDLHGSFNLAFFEEHTTDEERDPNDATYSIRLPREEAIRFAKMILNVCQVQ